MDFYLSVQNFYTRDDNWGDEWDEYEFEDENLNRILSVLKNWTDRELSWSVKENCTSLQAWSNQSTKGQLQGNIIDLNCIASPNEKKIELSFKFAGKIQKRAVKELCIKDLKQLVAPLIDESVCWVFSLEEGSDLEVIAVLN
ncbi:MAG TPA: hypothetical protein V6D11_02335 [Waterburya sp.]|jgi:hypothetical protein